MKRVMELFSYVIPGIIWLMVFVAILTLATSCASLGPPTPEVEPISQGTQVVWKTIHSTDWLSAGFMVAIVCGVFAGLNGIKTGFLAALASFVGLVLKSALSVPWVYSVLAIGLVCVLLGGVLLVAASILRKNRSIEQIIAGTQRLKKLIPDVDNLPEDCSATTMLASKQDKVTQALVMNTKTKMKLKGKL